MWMHRVDAYHTYDTNGRPCTVWIHAVLHHTHHKAGRALCGCMPCYTTHITRQAVQSCTVWLHAVLPHTSQDTVMQTCTHLEVVDLVVVGALDVEGANNLLAVRTDTVQVALCLEDLRDIAVCYE